MKLNQMSWMGGRSRLVPRLIAMTLVLLGSTQLARPTPCRADDLDLVYGADTPAEAVPETQLDELPSPSPSAAPAPSRRAERPAPPDTDDAYSPIEAPAAPVNHAANPLVRDYPAEKQESAAPDAPTQPAIPPQASAPLNGSSSSQAGLAAESIPAAQPRQHAKLLWRRPASRPHSRSRRRSTRARASRVARRRPRHARIGKAKHRAAIRLAGAGARLARIRHRRGIARRRAARARRLRLAARGRGY